MRFVRANRYTKTKAALSQLLCVLLVNGNENEMLSSHAWRTQDKRLIGWLDWWFGAGHCAESWAWEQVRDKND